jgi:hypothetical protein
MGSLFISLTNSPSPPPSPGPLPPPLYIHGTWPTPGSRASQPERTTWRSALGDGQAELDDRRPEDRASGNLGDQGRTLLGTAPPLRTEAPVVPGGVGGEAAEWSKTAEHRSQTRHPSDPPPWLPLLPSRFPSSSSSSSSQPLKPSTATRMTATTSSGTAPFILPSISRHVFLVLLPPSRIPCAPQDQAGRERVGDQEGLL